MLKQNVGLIDRVVRAIMGLGLILAYFTTTGGAWHWLLLLGVIPLATAALATCPLYSMLGLSTGPSKA